MYPSPMGMNCSLGFLVLKVKTWHKDLHLHNYLRPNQSSHTSINRISIRLSRSRASPAVFCPYSSFLTITFFSSHKYFWDHNISTGLLNIVWFWRLGNLQSFFLFSQKILFFNNPLDTFCIYQWKYLQTIFQDLTILKVLRIQRI